MANHDILLHLVQQLIIIEYILSVLQNKPNSENGHPVNARCLFSEICGVYIAASGVASVNNGRGEYSYIRVHRPSKQSISKEINDAKHDILIFARPIIDPRYATDCRILPVLHWHCFLSFALKS